MIQNVTLKYSRNKMAVARVGSGVHKQTDRQTAVAFNVNLDPHPPTHTSFVNGFYSISRKAYY